MKVSDQFILREIAGDSLLIPVGEAAISVKGLIGLSESGAFLFQKLKTECTFEELVSALTGEYDVSAVEAARDIDAFLNQMRQLHMLVEE